jgi:osmotically-inducible protein OsmY
LGVVGISNQITIKSVINTTTLSDDIYRALHRSWLYDSNDVIVRSELGNVTLTGCVRSYYERDLAEATAWAASGVTTVENDIEIG